MAQLILRLLRRLGYILDHQYLDARTTSVRTVTWPKERHEADKDQSHLHPAVVEFKAFVESNPRIRMHFRRMWQDADKPSVDGHTVVRDLDHMYDLLSDFVQQPPPWSSATMKLGSSGLPFTDIFYYAVLTPSGYAAFSDAQVTKNLKKLLMAWYHYLRSPASRIAFKTWLSRESECLKLLTQSANAPLGTQHSFHELFLCDVDKKYYGFTSWDDFFVRRFRPRIRPLCKDPDAIINACESTPLALVHNVKLQDEFWLKGAPYSLVDMFNDEGIARHFEGGTVYQAFLSQYSYHRWHAPVSGRVKQCYRIDGTYFLVPRLVEQYSPVETGHLDVERCQVALSCMCSRAIIVIEADDPRIGTVAFIAVGLHEVSTTEVSIRRGQRVRRGQEIGMFHYGGSTHCLVFQKGVTLSGFNMRSDVNVPVKAALAKIVPNNEKIS